MSNVCNKEYERVYKIYKFIQDTDAIVSHSSFEQKISSECEKLKSTSKEIQFTSAYIPKDDHYQTESLCYYAEIPTTVRRYTVSTLGTVGDDLFT